MAFNKHEPPPKANNLPAIWDLVKKDIEERDIQGEKKYGVRLQPCNGRNSAVDFYQEILDAVVYCRQLIEERKQMVEFLKYLMNNDDSKHVEVYKFLESIGELKQ